MSELDRIRREQEDFIGELGLESHVGTTTNGIPFHWVERRLPGRPWIVFLHGFPDSWWVWRDQIRGLIVDHSVMAFDLPGFGRALQPLDRSQLSLRGVIVPELCRLLARLDGPIHLVGHDLGALVTWFVAAELERLGPNRLARLTVFGVGHPQAILRSFSEPRSWLRARHWFLFALPRPVPETLLSSARWLLLRRLTRNHDELRNWLPELERSGALSAALDWFRGNRLFMFQPGTDLRVRAPVLAIRATGDLLYTSETQLEGSRRYVDGPFRIVQLEDMSHWSMRDDPALVNQLLRPLS